MAESDFLDLLHISDCTVSATPVSSNLGETRGTYQVVLALRPGYGLVYSPLPPSGAGDTLMNNIYIFTQPIFGSVNLIESINIGEGLLDINYDFDIYFCEFGNPNNLMLNVENYSSQTNAAAPKHKVINYNRSGTRTGSNKPSKNAFNPIKKPVKPTSKPISKDYTPIQKNITLSNSKNKK